jgi:hypothetical protein
VPRVSVNVLPGVRVYGGGCGGGAVAVMIGFVVVVGVVPTSLPDPGLQTLTRPARGSQSAARGSADSARRHRDSGRTSSRDCGGALHASSESGRADGRGETAGQVRRYRRAAPQPDATSEPADGRRWVPVISSRCPNCGAEDERPGGVFLCPTCGTQIPPEAHTATGQSVLER